MPREIKNYLDFNYIDEKIDCIISLNVLEHLDDDDSYIKKFYDFLPHNGKLVLYLPSSQIIWSNLDDLVNHKRRYSKKGLEKLFGVKQFLNTEDTLRGFYRVVCFIVVKIIQFEVRF